MSQRLQTAFPLGEVRPGLHGRVDTELYQSALALCRDAMPVDGFRNRCGLRFAFGTLGDAYTVIAVVPFVASTGDPYSLWFYTAAVTNRLRFRVVYDGAWVISAAPPAPVDVAVATQTGFPVPSLPLAGHVRYSQVADEIYIAVPGVELFRVRRLAHNQWDTQITPMPETDPAVPRSISGVALVVTGSRLLPAGDNERIPARLQINRMYRGVEFNGPFFGSPIHASFKVPYLYDDDLNRWGYVWNLLVESSPTRWTQEGATAAWYYNVDLAPALGALGPSGLYRLMQGEDPSGVIIPSALTKVATLAAVQATADTWAWVTIAGVGTTIVCNVNGLHPITQFTVPPPTPPDPSLIGYVFTMPDQSYKVYLGLGANAEQADSVGYVFDRQLPFFEFAMTGPAINYADTPYEDELPFNQDGGLTIKDFPLAVAVNQQRLWVGGLDTSRNTIHASRLGQLDQFGFHTPMLADDAMELPLASERVDLIRHLLPHQEGLLVFTNGDVWRMLGNSFDTISFTRLGNARASTWVQPITLDDRVIFVDDTNRVLELLYDDQSRAWQTVERSNLSSHLFKDRRIVSWGWQANPGRVLWAVQDDGSVLSAVISPDFQLWGWSMHRFACGDALWVNILPGEDGIDQAWFAVAACDEGDGPVIVWGQLQHHGDNEEWTSATSVFLDYYIIIEADPETPQTVFDLPPATLPWLASEVTVVADGQVIEAVPITEDGGVYSIDLAPFPPGHLTSPAYPAGSGYLRVVIGLPYYPTIRTLPLNDAPDRKKRLANLALRLRLTQGLQAGPELDKMEEMKSRSFEHYDVANELTTGTIILQLRDKWSRDGQVYFRQPRPMPMAVESIVPTYEKGDG